MKKRILYQINFMWYLILSSYRPKYFNKWNVVFLYLKIVMILFLLFTFSACPSICMFICLSDCQYFVCLSTYLSVNNFAHHLGQFVLVFLTLAFGALDITSIRTIPGVRFQKKTPVAEGEMEKGAIHCYKGLEIRDNGFISDSTWAPEIKHSLLYWQNFYTWQLSWTNLS